MEVPATFCSTMEPSGYFPPDAIVLGVKLDEVAYGMHVKVLQVFQGDVAVEDTLTVWGDNGGCCRWFVNTWNDGDTVLWAFNETDLMGNIIDPDGPQLEQEEDYCINVCGVYWLGYSAGIVSIEVVGGMWAGEGIVPGVMSMPIDEFWPTVMNCGAVGIGTTEPLAELSVRTLSEGIWLSLPMREVVVLQLTDALGKVILRRRWDGEPLWIGDVATGLFTVSVESARGRTGRKLFMP